tara:strand:+ start:324 stop:506 length:183 start_codon:yes stop_codon:yes gene_type:complete
MMFWYEVEIEVNFFGKANEYIQADNKETAEKIAIRKITKSLGCSEKEILSVTLRRVYTKI